MESMVLEVDLPVCLVAMVVHRQGLVGLELLVQHDLLLEVVGGLGQHPIIQIKKQIILSLRFDTSKSSVFAKKTEQSFISWNTLNVLNRD